MRGGEHESAKQRRRGPGILALIFLFTVGAPPTAGRSFAQDNAGCVRQGRTICIPATAATLVEAEGDVRRSRGVGFSVVTAGAELVGGDRLMVRNGAALINLGGHCEVRLGANSLVSFTRSEKGLCGVGRFIDVLKAQPPQTQTQAPQRGGRAPDSLR
ncbi:MAG: hypothetical protein ACK4MV_07975 [Beijerinckiaceae bacterium]